MSAEVLDGIATAAAITEEPRGRVHALAERGVIPGLGTLLVGDNPASWSYVTAKPRDCVRAVVLGVGVTRVGTTQSGRAELAGDIDPAVAEVASWLSPNPGGVGPMTRALLANVVEAAERVQTRIKELAS